MRKHRVSEAKTLELVPANKKPPATNRVRITERDGFRVIESNDIPKHTVGEFPNRGNPNAIAAQSWTIKIPLQPAPNDTITPLHQSTSHGPPNMPFGVGINGVLFEPGTAEFWMGDRHADWNYEALGGAVGLGLDSNHAHVQPGGIYHYHGLPTGTSRRTSIFLQAKRTTTGTRRSLAGQRMDFLCITPLVTNKQKTQKVVSQNSRRVSN